MLSEEIAHVVENSFVSGELAVVAFDPCPPYKSVSGAGAGEALLCEERPRLPCGRQQWLTAAPLQAAAEPISPAGGASGKTCEEPAKSLGGL